jgi:hypothetical protein
MFPEGRDRLGVQVSQAAHGFLVGDSVRYNGSTWVKALATSFANAAGAGIVVLKTTNDFVVAHGGRASIAGGGKLYGSLSAGATYYLSNSTAGLASTTAPTTGAVKVAFTAISTTEAIISDSPPVTIVPPLTEFIPVPVATATLWNNHTTGYAWSNVSAAAYVPVGARYAVLYCLGVTFDASGRAYARKNSGSAEFEIHFQYGRTGGNEEVTLVSANTVIVPLHTDRSFDLKISDNYSTERSEKFTVKIVGYVL